MPQMSKAVQVAVEADKLLAKLLAKLAKATKDDNVSVIVGYSASYALYIHENINPDGTPGKPNPPKSDAQRRAMFASIHEREERGKVSWKPGKPRFLSDPAKRLKGEYAKIIVAAVKTGKTWAQALMLCGLRLQRESQKEVPVDTGMLKNSAFTELESPAK